MYFKYATRHPLSWFFLCISHLRVVSQDCPYGQLRSATNKSTTYPIIMKGLHVKLCSQCLLLHGVVEHQYFSCPDCILKNNNLHLAFEAISPARWLRLKLFIFKLLARRHNHIGILFWSRFCQVIDKFKSSCWLEAFPVYNARSFYCWYSQVCRLL